MRITMFGTGYVGLVTGACDGRNLYVPDRMRDLGWTYLSVGRQRAGA